MKVIFYCPKRADDILKASMEYQSTDYKRRYISWKKNESNITGVTQNKEQLDNSDEQSQQNEKTFSQEEVSQLIKERIARERKKSDERIKDAKENNDSNEVAYLLKGGKVTKV